jgi:hypothetical protein
VLSHRTHQHLDNLFFTDSPAFDLSGYHPHIADRVAIELPPILLQLPTTPDLMIRPHFTLAAIAVLNLFLQLAFLGAVVLDAPLGRSLLPVRFFAPKRTAQIPPPRVSWMSQKENPAMPAPRRTPVQISSGPQNAPQHDVVLPHQGAHLAFAIPIRIELKMLLDFDD